MPNITEDRVLESTVTTGTGAIALAGSITGFRRFSAVCGVGDTAPYFIEAVDSLGQPTGEYEYGVGTYSGVNTLTRTKVLGSSNAGATVNFAAGNKNVGVAALGGALVPTGASFDMTGSVVPSGYVEANGALLSRAAFPALWAYAQSSGNISANDGAWLGGGYSPGDGATTFRVPDARGEFVRGWDHGRGVDAARAIGSSQAQDIQPHTHPIRVSNAGFTGGNPAVQYAPGDNNGTTLVPGSGITYGIQNSAGTETRPRNIAWMKIIKT